MKLKFLLMLCITLGVMIGPKLQAQWIQLGNNLDSLNFNGSLYINSMCTDAQGTLYAAGRFMDASGSEYVAKWNGTRWVELGTGNNALNANNYILSICCDPSGNIYAAGNFTSSGGIYAYVAKWDGASWSEVGPGQSLGLTYIQDIKCLTSDSAGNIYAAGDMTDATAAHYMVSKWDGSNWSVVGALNANATVNALAVDGNKLYAAGEFVNGNLGSGSQYVAVWNGTTWSELGGGSTALNANGSIFALCVDASHNVYAGGHFQDANTNEFVAKWNGSAWSEVGGASGIGYQASGDIYTITADMSGNIYAAGGFINSTFLYYVAKWNGTAWSDCGMLNGSNFINVVISKGNKLYAAGTFANANNYPYVAEYTLPTAVPVITQYKLSVYPNPTNGAGKLLFDKALTGNITLTDVTGKTINVWHTENEEIQSFNLNAYPEGMYFIRIETAEGQSETLRIVKN